MPAILFGSLGSLADTSELQRLAFNEAFCQAGLGWRWSRNYYMELLQTSGGRQRIAIHGDRLGQAVDLEAIYQLKNRLFCQALMAYGVEFRPGVMETIRDAKRQGFKLGLVTTTALVVVETMLSALGLQVNAADFDCIVDGEDVLAAKPSPEAYLLALDRLGLSASEAIAIEDRLDGLASARGAGLDCVAFPGAFTSGHRFVGAVLRRRRLDFATLVEQMQLRVEPLQNDVRPTVVSQPSVLLSAA